MTPFLVLHEGLAYKSDPWLSLQMPFPPPPFFQPPILSLKGP